MKYFSSKVNIKLEHHKYLHDINLSIRDTETERIHYVSVIFYGELYLSLFKYYNRLNDIVNRFSKLDTIELDGNFKYIEYVFTTEKETDIITCSYINFKSL